MEDVVGILLYNSFIELPGSNQTFGENQGLPRARQAERKEHAMYCEASEDLRKCKGKFKRKQRHCVKSHHTKDIFAFCFKIV